MDDRAEVGFWVNGYRHVTNFPGLLMCCFSVAKTIYRFMFHQLLNCNYQMSCSKVQPVWARDRQVCVFYRNQDNAVFTHLCPECKLTTFSVETPYGWGTSHSVFELNSLSHHTFLCSLYFSDFFLFSSLKIIITCMCSGWFPLNLAGSMSALRCI